MANHETAPEQKPVSEPSDVSTPNKPSENILPEDRDGLQVPQDPTSICVNCVRKRVMGLQNTETGKTPIIKCAEDNPPNKTACWDFQDIYRYYESSD